MATLAVNFAVGLAAGFLLSLFTPDQKAEGPRLDDLSSPKSSYGTPIARIWGSVRLTGNLIWAESIREVVNKRRSGGKGFGPKVEETTYSYFGTFALLLCEGPVAGIRRIWLNGKVVYDVRPGVDQGTLDASGRFTGYFRFYYGNDAQTPDPRIYAKEGADLAPAYRGRAYIVFEELPLADYGNRFPQVSVEVYTGSGTATLETVLTDICGMVGLQPSEIDVSEVQNEVVTGFYLNTSTTARDALTQLQTAYFFDVAETNGKLRFIKQQRPGVSMDILPGALATHEYGQSRPPTFTETRTQDVDLPYEIDVTYTDQGLDYQRGVQYARRQFSLNDNQISVQLPIVLSQPQAKTIADRALYLAWTRRREFQFKLPFGYVFLDPGDLIAVVLHGTTQILTISRMAIGANRLLEITALPYGADELLNWVSSLPAIPPSTSSLFDQGNTALYLLDTSLVQDGDPENVLYVASGGGQRWRNAVLYVSKDSGANYSLILQLLTKSTMGTCSTVLGSALSTVIDRANTLTVVLESGDLESESELNFLNGANRALVGSEIIRFQTATLIAPNTYVLSALIRGDRGTEWAMTHAAGERFYLLTDYLEPVQGQVSDLGVQRLFKAPTSQQSLDAVSATVITPQGNSMKPYAPTQIRGTRDGSGNLTIAWIRRDRRAGEWRDYSDIPISETSESYQVDVMNGVTVVRTAAVTTSTLAYAAAEQTADFGSPQASVTVRIYQMSAVVGRGFKGEATV